MKKDKNNAVVVYAGGHDYTRLVKELKNSGVDNQVKVVYKEKTIADVLMVVNKEAGKSGKVPTTWSEEERNELGKIRGRRVGYFDENILTKEKKLTQKEVNGYNTYLAFVEFNNMARTIAMISMASKYGETYKETEKDS